MKELSESLVAVHQDPSLTYSRDDAPRLEQELRGLLGHLGADPKRPLATCVRPGDTVLLKPNLVFDRVSDPRAALTNGWFIKVVCDLALEALGGRGRVVIADVALQSADFGQVVGQNGLGEIVSAYRSAGAPVELLDLRKEWLEVGRDGIHRGLHTLPGDPLGYCLVNLARASELEDLGQYRSRFAVGDYDQDTTAKYHMSSERNEYLIPRTVLSADAVINLPKFKTHKKTGITCALKNLVGTCGHKSYLPHFREGLPRDGGDEFAIDHAIKEIQRNTIDRLKRTNALLYRTVRALGRVILRIATGNHPSDLRNVMAGSWFGNDTLWRTILDLNKIVRYADKEGNLQPTPQRRYLCIVDGIYGGEGDGPILPSVRHDGVLIAGRNPVLIDLIVCLLMGIEPQDIPQVYRAFDIRDYPLVEGEYELWRRGITTFVESTSWPLPNLRYRLAEGWEGHVRRREIGLDEQATNDASSEMRK